MKRPGLAFLIVLLSILVASLAADAQQPGKVYRIGFRAAGAPPPFGPIRPGFSLEALLEDLAALGDLTP